MNAAKVASALSRRRKKADAEAGDAAAAPASVPASTTKPGPVPREGGRRTASRGRAVQGKARAGQSPVTVLDSPAKAAPESALQGEVDALRAQLAAMQESLKQAMDVKSAMLTMASTIEALKQPPSSTVASKARVVV